MAFIRISFFVTLLSWVACVSPSKEHSEESIEDHHEVSSPIFHASHEPKKQNAPFSDVVEVGNTYYLSGQIGMDHSTRELVVGGIEAETKQTLENIKNVLAQHQLKMKDVVKVTVVLDTIEDFGAFNAIYTTYFPQKPARTTFAAEALARGAKNRNRSNCRKNIGLIYFFEIDIGRPYGSHNNRIVIGCPDYFYR